MFKYKILKKGRKWFHGEEQNKGYYWQASIEINEVSKDWKEGSIVEFNGRFEKKPAGVYLYPLTAEEYQPIAEEREVKQKERKKEREQKIIQQWMGYVKKQSDHSVYRNGVEKLRSMNLSAEQKQELSHWIRLGQINYLEDKVRDYLGYIKEQIMESEPRWYFKGEDKFFDLLKELSTYEEAKEFCESSEKKLDKLRQKFREQDHDYQKKVFIIQDISHGKDDDFAIGHIFRGPEGQLGKVVKTWKYFEEEVYIGGLMGESAWLKNAKCDTTLVTEQEKITFEKIEEERRQEHLTYQAEKAKEAKKDQAIQALFAYVKQHGIYPEGENNHKIIVEGKTIYDDFNLYGGGKMVVIQDNKVWALTNNGADGDNWSFNNIHTSGAGAIGYVMKIDNQCNRYIEGIIKD